MTLQAPSGQLPRTGPRGPAFWAYWSAGGFLHEWKVSSPPGGLQPMLLDLWPRWVQPISVTGGDHRVAFLIRARADSNHNETRSSLFWWRPAQGNEGILVRSGRVPEA